MDEFIAKMSEKTGIDKATAEKVVAFLKEHSEDALKLIQSDAVKSHLPGGLGKLF
ncbi:MAG TPA: hypothetical protein VGM88_01845 [Kofleriaceae bacterium]|jgi:hypothetical protein